MVYLNNVQDQWPWNPNDTDMSNKEIYTHRVSIKDATDIWKVPVLPPMNGFVYNGMRVLVFGKDAEYTMSIGGIDVKSGERIMSGERIKSGEWVPLPFLGRENSVEILMKQNESCWGKVEFVAHEK